MSGGLPQETRSVLPLIYYDPRGADDGLEGRS
jgi:hypothetical protein